MVLQWACVDFPTDVSCLTQESVCGTSKLLTVLNLPNIMLTHTPPDCACLTGVCVSMSLL